MSPYELKHFNDLVETSADVLATEMARLRTMEKEYQKLMTLISLLVEYGNQDDSIHITITKQTQVLGKDWRDILERSLGSKNETK